MLNVEKKSYATYIISWKERKLEEEKKRRLLQKKGFELAEKAAHFLAKRYNIKKVVLFGSLVRGRYKKDSDIDLAVEGLRKEDYIRALAEVESLVGRPIDIKPLEGCGEFFKKRVERGGKVLYEK